METSRPKPPTEADILARLTAEQRAKLDALSPGDRAKALAAFVNIQVNLERLAPETLAKLGPPFGPTPPTPPEDQVGQLLFGGNSIGYQRETAFGTKPTDGIVEIDDETVACSPDQGPTGPGTWADDRPPINVRYGYGHEHAPGGLHRPQDPPNFNAILDKLPPELRDKAAASLRELGAVMAAYHPDKLAADGPPAQPIATAPVPNAPAPPGQDWKAAMFFDLAMKALKASTDLDRVTMPLIARNKPKSMRQLLREVDELREAWQASFGVRKAILDAVQATVEAKSPEELMAAIQRLQK